MRVEHPAAGSLGLERRPVREDDGAALHVIVGDAEVSRWLRPAGVTEPISREEAERWAQSDAAHWRAHGFGPWLLLDGGTPVARGGLRHTLVDGRAEVEALWAVARTHWGRGVATAIGRDALALADDRGIAGVVAFTRTDNAASRRVMEKLGLQRERELTHAGLPHVLYRKIRPST